MDLLLMDTYTKIQILKQNWSCIPINIPKLINLNQNQTETHTLFFFFNFSVLQILKPVKHETKISY